MGVLGLAGTFLPQELLAQMHVPADRILPLFFQLAGALYIAFAMLNWTMKESVIGGIYNRPLAMGNLVHFTAGGLALLKGAIAGHAPVSVTIGAAIYALFAVAFARIAFTSPVTSG